MEAVEQGRWTYAIFLQPDGKCWGRDIIKALQAERRKDLAIGRKLSKDIFREQKSQQGRCSDLAEG